MKSFDYFRAETVEAALGNSGGAATKFIAGGTNLLDLMKLEIETPELLVDISRLDLRTISETSDGGLSIGTLVSNSDLAADMRVRKQYPVLARALLAGASAQLRNMASTGGNLLQCTRCPYFYDTAASCNKRQRGAGCAAIDGFNRNHAILGTSAHCIAAHASDMAIAMRALGATIVTLAAVGGGRRIALADLYHLPGDTPDIETALQPGELISHIELPPPPKGRQLYRKVRDRASYAFALFSIAGIVATEEGRITSAALAYGGIAPVPWRDESVEQALIGKEPSTELFESTADILLADATGYGSNDFKIPLARRTLIAALRELTRDAI